MMTMRQVASSAVRELGFDPDESVMKVVYANGSAYRYSGVSPEEYDSLLSSQSVGKLVRDVVKGKPFERVTQ